MKQSITAPVYAVNNVSALPDIVKNQAVSVKTTMDKASVDIKSYEESLIAELNGNNGSKKIGHNSLNIASDNVGDAIEEVYAAIASTVLGEIPDNSITNAKLAIDAKVGSVASLTTTEKSNVVGAINEIDAYVDGVPEQADTIETNLNILRTAKVTTGSNVALAVDTDGIFDMTRNGNVLTIIPNVANTGAMTIAVDGQTARAIQKANDAGTLVALEAGDIKQNVPVQLVLQTSGTPVFIYAPKGGSNIKSSQFGFIQTTNNTPVNIPLTPLSNLDNCILEVYVISSSAGTAFGYTLPSEPVLTQSNLQITGKSAISQTIVWRVTELQGVKSIQKGVFAGSGTTASIAISAQTTTKNLITGFIFNASAASGGGNAHMPKGYTYDSTYTNIYFNYSVSFTGYSIRWYYVEYN